MQGPRHHDRQPAPAGSAAAAVVAALRLLRPPGGLPWHPAQAHPQPAAVVVAAGADRPGAGPPRLAQPRGGRRMADTRRCTAPQCGALIGWARTPDGNAMPLDPDSRAEPDG